MYNSTYEFAEKLMELDNEVTSQMGLNSRPSGPLRAVYIEQIIEQLQLNGIAPNDITADVIDILEGENFHSMCAACMIYAGVRDLEEEMGHERHYYPELF